MHQMGKSENRNRRRTNKNDLQINVRENRRSRCWETGNIRHTKHTVWGTITSLKTESELSAQQRLGISALLVAPPLKGEVFILDYLSA